MKKNQEQQEYFQLWRTLSEKTRAEKMVVCRLSDNVRRGESYLFLMPENKIPPEGHLGDSLKGYAYFHYFENSFGDFEEFSEKLENGSLTITFFKEPLSGELLDAKNLTELIEKRKALVRTMQK